MNCSWWLIEPWLTLSKSLLWREGRCRVPLTSSSKRYERKQSRNNHFHMVHFFINWLYSYIGILVCMSIFCLLASSVYGPSYTLHSPCYSDDTVCEVRRWNTEEGGRGWGRTFVEFSLSLMLHPVEFISISIVDEMLLLALLHAVWQDYASSHISFTNDTLEQWHTP